MKIRVFFPAHMHFMAISAAAVATGCAPGADGELLSTGKSEPFQLLSPRNCGDTYVEFDPFVDGEKYGKANKHFETSEPTHWKIYNPLREGMNTKSEIGFFSANPTVMNAYLGDPTAYEAWSSAVQSDLSVKTGPTPNTRFFRFGFFREQNAQTTKTRLSAIAEDTRVSHVPTAVDNLDLLYIQQLYYLVAYWWDLAHIAASPAMEPAGAFFEKLEPEFVEIGYLAPNEYQEKAEPGWVHFLLILQGDGIRLLQTQTQEPEELLLDETRLVIFSGADRVAESENLNLGFGLYDNNAATEPALTIRFRMLRKKEGS